MNVETMREYQATFKRASDGEMRFPSFKTDETGDEHLRLAAFKALHAIPYLGGDWELVKIQSCDAPAMRAAQPHDAIAEKIIEHIRAGRYKPGRIMPAQNRFAREFGTSRSTMWAVFNSLRECGHIKTSGRGSARKTFVCKRSERSSR